MVQQPASVSNVLIMSSVITALIHATRTTSLITQRGNVNLVTVSVLRVMVQLHQTAFCAGK